MGQCYAQQFLEENTAEDSPGNPLRGVSVHYLSTTFTTEVLAAGFSKDTKIYELEPKIIRGKGQALTCPRDGLLGTAYVDALEGNDNVGIATSMLSYTWGYSMLGDVIPSLEQHCKDAGLDPKRTYVWICCLCVNQHRVKARAAKGDTVPFKEFQATFADCVQKIGHVLALMSPWQGPVYLERVWCVYEMFVAVTTQTKVTVLMPPAQKAGFCETLKLSPEKRPIDQLYKALTNVDVENAKASVPEDRTLILEILRGPDGPGVKKLNLEVQSFLKQWLVQTMEHEFNSLLHAEGTLQQKAELCSNVGHMLFDSGHYGRAVAALKDGMEFVAPGALKAGMDFLAPGGMPDTVTMLAYARILAEYAFLEMKQGRFETSADAFEQAKSMYSQCGAFVSDAGATLCDRYGALLRKINNLEGAMDMFMQGYRIREDLNQCDTPSAAGLLGNIGYVHELQGDLKTASVMYERAKDLRSRAGTLKTPGGALLLTSIAKLNERQGALEGAITIYEEARDVREQTNTLRTPSGALLLAWMGSLKARLHDFNGSQVAYQLAKQIRIDTGTLDTTDGKKLLEAISDQEPMNSRHRTAKDALVSL